MSGGVFEAKYDRVMDYLRQNLSEFDEGENANNAKEKIRTTFLKIMDELKVSLLAVLHS